MRLDRPALEAANQRMSSTSQSAVPTGEPPEVGSVVGDDAEEFDALESSISSDNSIQSGLVDNLQSAAWLVEIVERIEAYRGKAVGWKGEGTFPPSERIIAEAIDLLTQFATEMPSLKAPSVSPDSDGEICIYWNYPPMMATISVHGDGTYSYYAEGYDVPARSDEETIGQPLRAALISTMVDTADYEMLTAA